MQRIRPVQPIMKIKINQQKLSQRTELLYNITVIFCILDTLQKSISVQSRNRGCKHDLNSTQVKTMAEIKNIMCWINNRLDTAEEKITELEDKAI